MSWCHFIIEDDYAGRIKTVEFMDKFAQKGRDAGVSEGVSVYQGKTIDGKYIYYFSPVASSIAQDILRTFKATPCSEEPDLEGCTEIKV